MASKLHCRIRDMAEGADRGESNLVLLVNRLRQEVADGRVGDQELDRQRMRLARRMHDRESIRLDIHGLETQRFDEAALTALFDIFDKLKDRILRFEVRGSRLLKVFLRHACFNPTRAGNSSNTSNGHGTLRGNLFNAEVFHNGTLSSGTIRVYGTEREKSPSSGPGGERHSFELTSCA